MKKIHLLSILFLAFSLFLACNKTVEEPSKAAYIPSDLDVKAGTWKTYILATPNDVTIADAKAINSDEYKAEIAKLKTSSSNLSDAQHDAIAYWGAGAVYRWNEIARELCAKYNYAPAPNADGTYTVPNADSTKNNANYYPRFPFANPPYASRALAYMSVAQYDALVAAWNYKYKFNRLAPSKNDASVGALLPVSDLPSYPSEDAVVASASAEVLKAMFPGEVTYIQSKLDEHKNTRLWAALNVESDITAGNDLGKAVAGKVMARAKTDGMGAANNQTLVPALIDNAKKNGTTTVWVSQESPARPPLLPNFGAVLPWNFAKADLATIRPAAPPAIGSDQYKKDLEELVAISKNQTREQARIASFWADGGGSYTPPGHWHRIAANLCFDNKYSEVRCARTMALVATALEDAGISCWETKNFYYYPRPQQMDSRVKTSVGLPNFQSYTSGHSTFSSAGATVLSYVFPSQTSTLEGYAKEASESRIYGCIHYRFDCEVGLVAGKVVGNYAIQRGKSDGSGL